MDHIYIYPPNNTDEIIIGSVFGLLCLWEVVVEFEQEEEVWVKISPTTFRRFSSFSTHSYSPEQPAPAQLKSCLSQGEQSYVSIETYSPATFGSSSTHSPPPLLRRLAFEEHTNMSMEIGGGWGCRFTCLYPTPSRFPEKNAGALSTPPQFLPLIFLSEASNRI